MKPCKIELFTYYAFNELKRYSYVSEDSLRYISKGAMGKLHWLKLVEGLFQCLGGVKEGLFKRVCRK